MTFGVLKRWLGESTETVDERRELERRSIQWIPAWGSGPSGTGRSEGGALFVQQGVLLDVRRHLATDPREALFGFLEGRAVEEEEGDVYVRVEKTRAVGFPLPIRENFDLFREAWEEARRDASAADRELVGWYQNHGILGLDLTDRDRRIHLEFFPRSWHCVLVLAPGRDASLGGFFQRRDRKLYFGRVLVPFFEVCDDEPGEADSGPRRTSVDWISYRASEPVELVPPKEVATADPPRVVDSAAAKAPGVGPNGETRGKRRHPPPPHPSPDRRNERAGSPVDAERPARPVRRTSPVVPPRPPVRSDGSGATGHGAEPGSEPGSTPGGIPGAATPSAAGRVEVPLLLVPERDSGGSRWRSLWLRLRRLFR